MAFHISPKNWPEAPPGHVALGQLTEALIEARVLHELVQGGAGSLGAVNRDPRFLQALEAVTAPSESPAVQFGKLAGATVISRPSVDIWEGLMFLYLEGAATSDGTVRTAAFIDAPAPALTGTARDLTEAVGALAQRARTGLLRPLPSRGLPVLGRAFPPPYHQLTEASPLLLETTVLAEAATAEAFDSQQHLVRLTATDDLMDAVLDEQLLQHSGIVDEATAVRAGKFSPAHLLMLAAADYAGNHLDIVDVENGVYRAAITWNVAVNPTSFSSAAQSMPLEAFVQMERTALSSERATTLFVTMPRLLVHSEYVTGNSPETFDRLLQRAVLTRLLQEFPTGIRVVPRDAAIDLILQTWDFNTTELVDEATAPPSGKLLPADTALIPTVLWEERGSNGLINLLAVHVNRGEVVWAVQESLYELRGSNFFQSLGFMAEDYGDALLYGGEVLAPAPGSPMLAVQVEPGGVETSVHTRTLAIIGAMMTGDPETAEGRTLRVHMEPASYWEGGPSTPLLPEFQMETDIRGELSASSAPSHGSPLGELISEYGRDAVVPGFTLLVRLVWDCWTLQERSTGASVVQIAQVSVTAAAWPFGGIGLDLRVSPFLFWNDRLPPDVIEEREPWRDLVGCSELPQVRWSRWPQNPAVSPGRIGYIVMPLANSIQFSYKDRDLLAQLVTER